MALCLVASKILAAHSLQSSSEWQHILPATLNLFRDASQDRINHNLPPPPSISYNMIAFKGVNVLSKNQTNTGLERFEAENRLIDGYLNHGKLLFGKTPDDNLNGQPPNLIAVFVPYGIDPLQPIPMHIFFPPNRGGYGYPYADNWNQFVNRYLVQETKRLLNQHIASQKKCVFVFPVGRWHHINAIEEATSLRRYLTEVVYWIHADYIGGYNLEPKLGKCAISAFSYAGKTLLNLIKTSQGANFPELQECYALDIYLEDSKITDFKNEVVKWLNKGESGRVVRIYTSQPANKWKVMSEIFSDQSSQPGTKVTVQPTTTSVGGAEEYQANNATFLLTPITFWVAIYNEDKNSSNTGLNGYFTGLPNSNMTRVPNSLHQVMPGVFLEHALKNSGFLNI